MDAPQTITDSKQLKGKTPLQRTRLYIGDGGLLSHVVQKDTGEGLVGAKELEAFGLLVHPFWVDDPEGLEGQAYQAYITGHPDFGLSVRHGVAERLAQAQKQLPMGWQIVLKAGFRPLEVQYRLFDDAHTYLRDKHPYWSDDKLLEETRKLVADPRVRVPPHSTGAAVDIEILNTATNQLVDMGARANTDGEAGWAYSPVITKTQQARRLTLLKAMLDVGFANHAYEWWHFSWGDAVWAVFYDQPATQYALLGT